MATIVPATNATAGPFSKVVGVETAESGARPGIVQRIEVLECGHYGDIIPPWRHTLPTKRRCYACKP